jgi:hypothetical protein
MPLNQGGTDLTTINFDAEQWELVAWCVDSVITHQRALLALAGGPARAHMDTYGNPRSALRLERLRKLVDLRCRLPRGGDEERVPVAPPKARLRAAMALAKDDPSGLPQKRDDTGHMATGQYGKATGQ